MEGLVATAAGSVSQALADADRTRFSALLRFLAALVPANVLHPSAVIGQLQRIVDVALEVAKTGTPLLTVTDSPAKGKAHTGPLRC